jgi:hypothetical protein
VITPRKFLEAAPDEPAWPTVRGFKNTAGKPLKLLLPAIAGLRPFLFMAIPPRLNKNKNKLTDDYPEVS